MNLDFKLEVEKKIEGILKAEKQKAPRKEVAILLERIRRTVLKGGKRIRPQLLYLTYEAYGGSDPESLIDLAAALELHHQFLLIHDDLIDEDTIRHGSPNIVGIYGKEYSMAKAQSIALLAGDLLFSFANRQIVDSKYYSLKHKQALIHLLNETNINAGYGELLDSLNTVEEYKNFNVKKLILTHSLKTASYSVQLPMLSAAILLGLPTNEKGKIQAFADAFGIYFQLVDDYADYFPNKSAFGKPQYRDYLQGKITYPLHIALESASVKEVNFLKHNLGKKDLQPAQITKVLSILEKQDAKEVSTKFLDLYKANSSVALSRLSIDKKYSEELEHLVASFEV